MAIAPEHPHVGPLNGGEASIEVYLDRARTGDYSAVVALRGEHDLATSEAVRVALAPLCGRILVDLAPCAFIDSTVISLLLLKARGLQRDGHSLELRAAAETAVAHTLRVSGVELALTIHTVDQ